MASTTQHSSSRFSTLKIFRLASSKPPPPPPKDAVYLYASANNQSLLSLSNQSVRPTTPSPKQTNSNGPLSIRSPSPTPSRVLQPSSPQQQHPSAPGYHQHQSPSTSMSSSTLSPDHGSGSSKRSFIRKLSNIGRRSASKSSRVASTEEASDDESISRPWNFQVSPHFSPSLLYAWALTFFFLVFSFLFLVTRAECSFTHTRTLTHTDTCCNIAPYPHRRSVRSHNFQSALLHHVRGC
jgi:hypothetical protein